MSAITPQQLPATLPPGTLAEPKLVLRTAIAGASARLQLAGISPLIADLFAKRGIAEPLDVQADLEDLLPPEGLLNCQAMADFLVTCREKGSRVLIISDYDCDGATACSVLLDAFQDSGMNSGFLVPNREIHGYGLTPEIVEEAAVLEPRPEFIITVDAGISSNAGVKRANELGIQVLITDHHLAPPELPDALLIVNPNQPGDLFKSKHIAGCGVAWYVATAYYEALVAKGLEPGFEPEQLLPYVALGTVADVVSLDKNNRILVKEGLRRIRHGECSLGIKALAVVGKREIELPDMTTQDFGFALGPRINAAGRLDWMNTGIQCLTTKNLEQAVQLAQVLNDTNEERKRIQEEMVVEAERIKDPEVVSGNTFSVAVFNPDFHKGVVGIVAGRMKETYYRPTFVLTQAKHGDYVGSGRSIPGFHLKHALDELHVGHPGLLPKFGGHAMAAGVTVAAGRLEEFTTAFEAVCKAHLTPELLEIKLEHDGPFPPDSLTPDAIRELHSQVWGQGFPYPLFVDTVSITECKQLSEGKHLKLAGELGTTKLGMIAFSHGDRLADMEQSVTVAHQPGINKFAGKESIQLQVSHFPGLPRLTAEFVAERTAREALEAAERAAARRAKVVKDASEQAARIAARTEAASVSAEGAPKKGGLLDRLRRAKEATGGAALAVPPGSGQATAAVAPTVAVVKAAVVPAATATPVIPAAGTGKTGAASVAPSAPPVKAGGFQARLQGLRQQAAVPRPVVAVADAVADAAMVEEMAPRGRLRP